MMLVIEPSFCQFAQRKEETATVTPLLPIVPLLIIVLYRLPARFVPFPTQPTPKFTDDSEAALTLAPCSTVIVLKPPVMVQGAVCVPVSDMVLFDTEIVGQVSCACAGAVNAVSAPRNAPEIDSPQTRFPCPGDRMLGTAMRDRTPLKADAPLFGPARPANRSQTKRLT